MRGRSGRNFALALTFAFLEQIARFFASAAISIFLTLSIPVAQADTMSRFDLPAQALAESLRAVGGQTNTNLLFDPSLVANHQARALKGDFTAHQALNVLLADTGIKHEFLNESTVTLSAARMPDAENAAGTRIEEESKEAQNASFWDRFRVAEVDNRPSSVENDTVDSKGARSTVREEKEEIEELRISIPEVLVVGSRILNMDIKRSLDDPQPYTIFDRATIERSGALDLNDFFKQRLTMNTTAISSSQIAGGVAGNASAINLRGLGANQTLILVDGHRRASTSSSGEPVQTDISGIPLAAIERIEVLPTTASGIYGGSATGGVVNVILRRDYDGAEVSATYDNTFESDSSIRRIEASLGFPLEGGKTDVLLIGSYSDANHLQVGDRSFVQRARARIQENNPAFFLPPNSPPIGASVNISSANGTPLVLRNGTPLNAVNTHVPAGYTGTASDGGAALVANAGRFDVRPPDSSQASLQGPGTRVGLLNAPEKAALNFMVRREFSEDVQAFLDFSATNNSGNFLYGGTSIARVYTIPSTAPNNPFLQPIRVTFPYQSDAEVPTSNFTRQLVAGTIFRLPGNWSAEIDHNYSTSRFTFGSSPFLNNASTTLIQNGTIDVIKDTNRFPVDLSGFFEPGTSTINPYRSTLNDTTLRLSGPLGFASLPGGPITLSTLLEYNDEKLAEGVFGNATSQTRSPSRAQTIGSAYVETRFPFVSEENHIPGLWDLELQIAARYDHYRIEGVTPTVPIGSTSPIVRETNEISSTNPTIAIRYAPVRDLIFRASYGTGFLPPAMHQLASRFQTGANSAGTGVDPRRGNTALGLFDLTAGGNSSLDPEESESTSVGVIFEPRFLSGLRLSLDYVRISKEDNIAELTLQQILDNEALFPERVTRGPNLPTDPAGWAGPVTAMDLRLMNVSRTEVEAYDLQGSFEKDLGRFGSLGLSAAATRQTHYKTQLLSGQPVVENAGVGSSFPLKLRAVAGLNWQYQNWNLGWNTRYFDSYLVVSPSSSAAATTIANQGGTRVPSQTYHDFVGSYSFPAIGGQRLVSFLDGTEIQFGVRNVLNATPPFDAGSRTGIPFYYSPFGDPRLASYYISVQKSF